MALTAARTVQTAEMLRRVSEHCILRLPGNPGDAYTRGYRVQMGAASGNYGTVIVAASDSATTFGRVNKTVTCPAATQAFPIPYPGQISGLDTDEAKTLVEVEVDIPAGTKVELGTITGQWDDTVVSYTAGTRTLVLTTGCAGNDYPDGGIIYIYEGTGKGQVNVVESYTHSGITLVTHRAWAVAPDSTSKVVILGGESATAAGIGFMKRCAHSTSGLLDMANGYENGLAVILMDFMESAAMLNNKSLPYVTAASFLLA